MFLNRVLRSRVFFRVSYRGFVAEEEKPFLDYIRRAVKSRLGKDKGRSSDQTGKGSQDIYTNFLI